MNKIYIASILSMLLSVAGMILYIAFVNKMTWILTWDVHRWVPTVLLGMALVSFMITFMIDEERNERRNIER